MNLHHYGRVAAVAALLAATAIPAVSQAASGENVPPTVTTRQAGPFQPDAGDRATTRQAEPSQPAAGPRITTHQAGPFQPEAGDH